MDIPFFSPNDSNRILDATRYTEEMRSQGSTDIDRPNDLAGPWDVIYARITAKDPDDKTGFFQLEEVVFNGDTWEAVEGGKEFNGTDYDYAHHFNWEDAEVNTVVKLKLIINVDTGDEEIVFFHEVTNPAAFVFIADETGNNSRSSDSSWSIIRGGSVLTNVGTIKMPSSLSMGQEGYAGVLMTFVEDDGSLLLASAIYTNSEGQYWVADEDEGTIIINFPLASSSSIGGKTELTQLHVGDIHLEISTIEDDVRILGDETWIHVNKNGNTWTVSHILPGTASLKKDGFSVLAEDFDCDQVAFSTVADVQDWINNVLLEGIQRISYDVRGHIYEQLNCDGSVVSSYDDDDVDDDVLTSTLLAASLSSQLVPNIIDTSSGISYSFTIQNRGKNFLDFIAAGDDNTIAGKNSLGEVVSLSKGDTAGAPNLFGIVENGPTIIEKVKNVGGTSGGTYGAGTELVTLDPLRFRFNDTLEVIGNVAGKAGIRKTVVIDTEVCTWAVTTSSTIVRDSHDPNAAEFTFTAQASIPNLNRAYKAVLEIRNSDDQRIDGFSIDGGKIFNENPLFMDLDATSTADAPGIFFNLQNVSEGDILKMTIKLVTDDIKIYDANVVSETFLSFSYEADCVIDEDGNKVTDGDADCITAIAVLPTIPASACPSPGTGAIVRTLTKSVLGTALVENDEAAQRVKLQDSALGVAGGSSSVGLNKDYGAGQFTALQRTASQYDFSGITGSPNINFDASNTSAGPDLEFVMFYKVAATLPAVNNPLFDMFTTWAPIGKFSPNGAAVNLNLSGLVPEVANVFIGYAIQQDFDNDFSEFFDISMTNSNIIGDAYNCS